MIMISCGYSLSSMLKDIIELIQNTSNIYESQNDCRIIVCATF